MAINVLFINDNIPDYQNVVDSVNSTTLPIVYSCNSTRTEIINILDKYNIKRIGFFNDSSSLTFLENEPFFDIDISDNISGNNYLFIISLINKYNIANIDYLACNTLNNPNYKKYYNVLNTFCIVGASNNATGNIQYGGDWIMESTAEDIESIYFTGNIQYYKYLLVSIANQGTGFKYNNIDICNNFIAMSSVTTQTRNGISFLAGFKTTVSGTSYDLAELYYIKNNVYEFGSYNMAPWNVTLTQYTNAKWIWNTSGANSSAAYDVNISFTYSFNYTGTTCTGSYNVICDNVGYLIFNGSAPSKCDFVNGSTNNTGPITILNGANYIEIICYNFGPAQNAAGLIGSFFDSASSLVAVTNSTWSADSVVLINSTNLLCNPISGGLWTVLYSNNNIFTASNSNDTSFFYSNSSARTIVTSGVVSNFYNSVMASFDSTNSLNGITPLLTYWGFKSTGFFVPNATGIWTFNIYVDDAAHLWIGSVGGGISYLTTPTLASYWSTPVSTTISLVSGSYYPIMLCYGQGAGGQSIQLTITSPSSTVYTTNQSSLFYYVNAKSFVQ